MSWYFVDASGQTQGPFEVSVMKQKYASKLCSDESYIWNGTSVNQWTPLKQVPELLNQVKVSQPAPARPSRPAGRRPNPFGGGGRANLLASIQKGSALKKVPEAQKKDASSATGGSSGGGGGGGGGRKPAGGGMDLMSQLRAKQNNMKKTGKMGGGGGGGWNKPKTSPKPATTTSPSKPSGGGSKWGNKSGGGGGATGGAAARKNKIKTKIDNLTITDWQFKAIEKILS